ncbi:mannose-6-phosphate isomerase, type 3 [Roseibium hamelinense]|uniref:Mannose-6-phosphate isomerase, type 3 n=1 Tax=Roseibium hamelinense TaxID=150831 RepID=A0A562T8L0_9HYPH|nr:AGE family epimerase/isomerase [Roseibium hamelinense]MTI42988.1 AGE family epimerase/isomerase [Roseibium hamelinense]TWI89598.1 mannose-6-phosphate isomerase, type 3 [Roseibium hamelinense]
MTENETVDGSTLTEKVIEASAALDRWALQDAFPFWHTHGIDPDTGAFAETLDLVSHQEAAPARRARVQPRQVFSFLEAADLGWDGPALQIARSGMESYLSSYFNEDGTAISAITIATSEADPTFDLYNQAFALFAMGRLARAIPQSAPDMHAKASALLDHLRKGFAHTDGGFHEANPVRAPLRSNPHMHLFEASLELEQTAEDTRWRELADEIADLALTKFIDPATGGLREFFDLDWSPMPDETGRIMEPGHQFEWAWLLIRWGILRNRADAISAARRLYQIGEQFGIDAERQVAIMALNDDLETHDPLARLWGQTEWIKAAVILARISVGPEQDAFQNDIVRASDALMQYFKDVPAGLWRDKLKEDGRFIDEPAPASSFYHIICAIGELHAFAADLKRS